MNDKKALTLKINYIMNNSNGVVVEHKNTPASEEIPGMKIKVGNVDAK